MKFTSADIARYYDLTEGHYRMLWKLEQSKALHYGFWNTDTRNLAEALLNTNRELAGLAGIGADDDVLDAGCGVGGSAIYLACEKGCRVQGISLSAKQCLTAARYAEEAGLSSLVQFRQDDFTASTFPDQHFSVIWAVESVCHASSKEDFIREAFRLLKPGGRLIMADFFQQELLNAKQQQLMDKWASGWAVPAFAEAAAFCTSLQKTGFSNIRQFDKTAAILPSARRLYRYFWPGLAGATAYRLLHPRATKIGWENIFTAYWQYKALKAGAWFYYIIQAEKPA